MVFSASAHTIQTVSRVGSLDMTVAIDPLLVSTSRTHYKTFSAWLNHLTAWLGETVTGCRAHSPRQSDRAGIERGRSRRQSHCNENF